MNPTILMMGLNHITTPVQVREQVALAQCRQPEALAALSTQLDHGIFSEALVLATCNRTEVYSLVADPALAAGALYPLLAHNDATLPPPDIYTHTNEAAVSHLFCVASGLDSMILGESEILGQVRTAYLAAAEARTIGPVMHRLFKDAIHTGKRSHAETTIGHGPQSVAYAAVTLARQLLGSLRGKNILVIGAGEMARRATQDMADDGASMVMVTNRTFDKAEELAQRIGGRAVRFDQLPETLKQADVVISATGAPHILLDIDMIRSAMASRSNALLLIDISVPRNISPDASNIPNVTLKNIDDVAVLTDSSRAARENAVREVRGIIGEEARSFWLWFMERKAAPTLGELRTRAEEIRTAELDKALSRLGHLQLTDRDRNVIAALSSGIVNKLLASPTARLKEHTQNGDGQIYLNTLRDLFDLDGNEHSEFPTTL